MPNPSKVYKRYDSPCGDVVELSMQTFDDDYTPNWNYEISSDSGFDATNDYGTALEIFEIKVKEIKLSLYEKDSSK